MIRLEYIVRSVGERTEEVCLELLKRQKKSEENIHIIRENTHALAVEQTISTGIQCNSDWVLAIDADMLLVPNGIEIVRDEVQSCPDNVAVVHPAVIDKLYRMRRWGLTVYRKSILADLLQEFLEIKKGVSLKIEGAAIKSLIENTQHEIIFSRNSAAIHDFYQYYRDLYRKAYLNTLRNPGFNKGISKIWKKLSGTDNDYLVMYKAMRDAQMGGRTLTNSLEDFNPEELAAIIEKLGLVEKAALSWDDYIDSCYMTHMSQEINSLDEFKIFNDFFDNPSLFTRYRSLLRKVIHGSGTGD